MLTDEKKILRVKAGLIPEEMKQAPRWVCWAAVEKVRNDGTRHFTKEPRQARDPSRKASSTNPATWSDFQAAMAAYEAGTASGIGFVLGDGWAGVDLDDVLNAEGNGVTREAEEIVGRLDSYTEWSPSGTGAHVIVRGDVAEGRKFGGVEIYGAGRYFAVTGQMIPIGAFHVAERQEELDELVAELDRRKAKEKRAESRTAEVVARDAAAARLAPPATEEEILAVAHRVCKGFGELWAGDVSKYGGDESRADMALAGSLAFICGPGQHELVRALMGRSALVRDKWRTNRTYLDRTINAAYESRDEKSFFDWTRQKNSLAVIKAVTTEVASADENKEGPPLDLTLATSLDDIGYARRLALECQACVKYVCDWQKWIYWDGRRWVLDDGAAAVQEAQRLRDRLWLEFAALPYEKKSEPALKFIRACGNAGHLRDIVTLTKSQAIIRIRHEQLDQHRYLLNVRNGTIDLERGLCREHRPEDFLTQLAAVEFDPEAKAERWEQFVAEAMEDDPELIHFLQVSAGVMLSGDVSSQLLWCHYGRGSNGKSTFLGALTKMLGDYAVAAKADFLMMKQGESHPTEVAMLYGKRLVTAIECEGGRRLRESFVKMITGGDMIAARRMKEDFWMMDPTWHVHVSFNDPPTITGTDDGIRRRLRIIPWRASFEGARKDTRVKERLESDEFRPGILNWCLAGMRAFMAKGLPTATAITEATDEYVAAQDLLGLFIEECCECYGGRQCLFSDFMATFHAWLETRGESTAAWKGKRVGGELKRRGFDSVRTMVGEFRNKTLYTGLSLAVPVPRP
jgi:putative DNA primase/helicase